MRINPYDFGGGPQHEGQGEEEDMLTKKKCSLDGGLLL